MELFVLRERIKEIMRERYDHVLGCEQESARLALRYGADERLAREAALLHDVTKPLNFDEQLKLCQKYGIILDTVEKNERKLLHALTGACVAGKVYDACAEVCRAIRSHTTGDADMALLDKILYLADYIEPTRNFPGLSELREEAERDLDGAVIMGLTMSVRELAESGRLVHPRTIDARNSLILRKET